MSYNEADLRELTISSHHMVRHNHHRRKMCFLNSNKLIFKVYFELFLTVLELLSDYVF